MNLKQLQETQEKRFDAEWEDTIGFQDPYKDGLSKQKLKSFLTSSTTEAYVLGRDETLKEVARVIEGMRKVGGYEKNNYQEAYNLALTDLKRALNLEEPRAENNQ